MQRSARDRRRLVNHNTIPGAEYSQNYVKIRTYSSSTSSKVDDFGTNRKLICEFLLVINCVFFIPLSYSTPPLPIFPLELQGEVKRQETRVMGLLCGEGYVILTSTVFD